MASPTTETTSIELERAELQTILQSHLFARSPSLAHFLSYLCEKKFSGESAQIKEYSIALEVFGRNESFDQDTDSIVRVQANRLRKRLAEYYSTEGAQSRLQITIPVGQYVPVFEQKAGSSNGNARALSQSSDEGPKPKRLLIRKSWLVGIVGIAVIALGVGFWMTWSSRRSSQTSIGTRAQPRPAEPPVGLPVGEEIRILSGDTRSYVDRAGKMWNPDAYFTGGTPVRSSVQHIWRTQDPSIYRSSRQGDFTYDIPLKAGIYELHLLFAETLYGPEGMAGGGEGSRVMSVTANGKPLLTDFDVVADAGGGRTADTKIFTDISPDKDGKLHLAFSSVNGRGMVSAIEILPGTKGHIRPVRIVARDVPYYSNDSHWWSPDNYFKGGQLSSSEEPAANTDDPELYETERWGHFSYAIPVTADKYTLILYFVERHIDGHPSSPDEPGERVFSVFCNDKVIVQDLNLLEVAGGKNHPYSLRITGLQPNPQGKLLLEFNPTKYYATVTAIEVIPE